MTFDEYQEKAIKTAIYPGKGSMLGISYCALKLNGEAGEVAEGVGKTIRDDQGVMTEGRKMKLALELGDVLWYIASLAKELDFTLDDIAAANVAKLLARQAAGTLRGSGSDR